MTDKYKERPNKSAAKREAQEIRNLADRLCALDSAARGQLDCDETVEEAVILAGKIHREAHRRQLSRIAKLLRERPELCERLRRYFEALESNERTSRKRFKQVEQWRDGFLGGDDSVMGALGAVIDQETKSQLMQYRADYQAHRSDRERKTAFRALFKLIASLDQKLRG